VSGKYFSKAAFDFLEDLRKNNNRVWFAENKSRYEEKLKELRRDVQRGHAPHALPV